MAETEAMMAIGGLISGMGALAFVVKALVKNGKSSGHTSPCDSLSNLWNEHVKLRDSQAQSREDLASIKASQKASERRLSNIEDHTSSTFRLVEKLIEGRDRHTAQDG